MKWSESHYSCLTLCDPMDCSLPGSSVQEILQARILEWVAISFFRGSSQPRDRIWASRIVGRCFTIWATKEVSMRYYYIPIRMSIIKNISHSKFCWEGRVTIKYFWGECKIIKTTLERAYDFKRSEICTYYMMSRLSNFTFAFHFHALEKEMATHSSVLAWRIPETVGPHLWGHTESDKTEVT